MTSSLVSKEKTIGLLTVIFLLVEKVSNCCRSGSKFISLSQIVDLSLVKIFFAITVLRAKFVTPKINNFYNFSRVH